jgi:archaellum component FlaF (FlaF/FlaG flagellin family)
MKNLKILAVFLLAIFMLTSVFAELTVSDVKLGSDAQNRGETTSTTVTVTNTGTLAATALNVTFTGVLAKYSATKSLSAVTIAPGASVTMTVTGFVPFDLDAVDSKGKKVSFDIGDISVKATYSDATEETKTVNLIMEAENNLEFSGSDVIIEGKTKSLRDGKEFTDVKRGDNIEAVIKLKNTFDNSGECDTEGENCDIEDVSVTLNSKDSDMDVDEDVDFSTINSDDSDEEKVSFSVPDDIDDGDYDFEMYVTGNDENGARHGEYIKFSFNVDVLRDEVKISTFSLSPETLECTEKQATLSITLENTGRDDQESVSVIIESAKLDVKESIYKIALDEADRTTKTFDIKIPDKTAAGQYFIQIIANVNNNDETDRQSATLVIKPCKPAVVTPVEPPKNNVDTPKSNTDVNIIEMPPATGVIYGTPKTEKGFFDSNEYVMLLGGIFAVALLLFVILIVVLLRK